jgi:hypothetical protein
MAFTATNDLSADFASLTPGSVYDIIEKIADTSIHMIESVNPLKELDKGEVENGALIEQIVNKHAVAAAYNKAAVDVFTKASNNLVTRYFNTWSPNQWLETVEEDEIRKILVKGASIEDIASIKVASLAESADADKYTQIKDILKEIATDVTPLQTAFMTVNYVDDASPTSIKDFIEAVRNTVMGFQFMNATHCYAGITTRCSLDNILIVMPYSVMNKLSVQELADAFQLSAVDMMARIVQIDTTDGYVYILDKRAFGVYTRLNKVTSQYNAKGLYTNYFLTRDELYYWSPLFKSTFCDATKLGLKKP